MKYRIVFLVFALLSALFAFGLYQGSGEQLQILLLPIIALSTILLMNTKISRGSFSSKKFYLETFIYLVIIAGLVLAIWRPGVAQSVGRDYLLLITYLGVAPAVLWRISESLKGFALPAYVISLAGFALVTIPLPYGLTGYPSLENSLIRLAGGLLPIILLTLGGFLIYENVRERAPVRWRRFWLSTILFALALLLFGYQVVNYDILDTATDGIRSVFTFFMLTSATIVVAFIMGWRLGWHRPYTSQLYAFSVIAVLFAAFSIGSSISPIEITEGRAERINRALLAYDQANGRYPESLQDLSPNYLLYVPAQVIIPSEGWCYQGGADYYRFGYVEREFFSMPTTVTVFAQAGNPPDAGWDCEAIAAKYTGY